MDRMNTETSSRLLIIAAVLFIATVLVPATAFAKVNIVTTLSDFGAVARAVGGERVEVKTLAPPNIDPHYVDPRPNLILHLNRADLLVINGLELESAWLDPLVKQARNTKINPGAVGHFVAAEYANLIDSGQVADRAGGDIHPGGNPHFYFDPTSMISIANGLRDRLTKIDPKGAETYEANAKTFTAELWKVAKSHAIKFARLPAEDRRVISYHASLDYVYRWLQLEQAATIEPKPGIPPNPKHVASVLSTMKSHNVDVIVQEQFYPQKTSKTLAKLAKAEVVVLAGGTTDEQSYIERVNQVAEALYAAVSK